MDSTILAAIETLRANIDASATEIKNHPKMAEIIEWHQALNALEGIAGRSRTPLTEFLGFGSKDTTADTSTVVRFDEFFGVPALEAGKRYLRKRTEARPFDEIVAAIKSGGGRVESEDDLRMGLSRSTLDVVKIGDRYGLMEHYPHIKRGGKKRKPAEAGTDPETEDKGEEKNEAANEG